ncbi:MAG TPA: protein kinase, partial [Blastocatellia bacterium]
MTPERWQEIDQLLTTALELEPEPRAAFLLQLAERDRELHAQVHTLLAAAERSSGFLESNLAEISRFSLPPQFVWQEGQLVAHYEVVSTLGAGGMGEVYLARDRKLGRRVALKLLPPFSTTIPDRVRRFELEARAASALNHPNILTIYEIGQHAGLHFIASEFVEGVTLRQKIAHGPLTLAESLDLISQVLAALSAAHSASIVHRDIKPENVMVRPDGLVKVLDFGLAKLHGGEAIQATSESSADADIKLHSMQSALMGTPPYMSPEQARGLDVDTRTDLFSLGVMLYEMVTGYPPFNGETVADMINALIEQEPLPLPAGRFPATLTEILRRCLAKNPHLRYGSARNVAQDLQLLAAELKPEGAAEISRSSIAILPFVDLSGDPDNELFCDGLAEDLLNALAKIERLHVAARTSAFSFKRKNADIREIGRLLKVETVLEGSVRRAGNQLRIMVQLVNAADGYHLWSERYDRQINDLFRIQDEITLALVQALKVQLLGEEKARLLKKYTDNTDAYQLYVKGRAYCHRATREGFDKAIEFFEQATAIEPDYAPAWAGIVYAYLSL